MFGCILEIPSQVHLCSEWTFKPWILWCAHVIFFIWNVKRSCSRAPSKVLLQNRKWLNGTFRGAAEPSVLHLSVSNFVSNLETWDKWVHDWRSTEKASEFCSPISEVWRWTMCMRGKVFSAELILSQCSWDHSLTHRRVHACTCTRAHTLSPV